VKVSTAAIIASRSARTGVSMAANRARSSPSRASQSDSRRAPSAWRSAASISIRKSRRRPGCRNWDRPGVGGNAQHVAEEARADHRGGEGGAQAVGVAQGVLGLFDLVGGEAAGLQDHVVDRRSLGQRAMAHGVAARGVEVGPGLGQANMRRGAEGRDQQAVGGLGGRDRRGGGGVAQGLAAQAKGGLADR
jgi:hypothetical protein